MVWIGWRGGGGGWEKVGRDKGGGQGGGWLWVTSRTAEIFVGEIWRIDDDDHSPPENIDTRGEMVEIYSHCRRPEVLVIGQGQ